MVDILQYLGTGLGILYVTLMSFKPSYINIALKISLVSCIILSIWGYSTYNYGIFASQFIYVILNAIAIYRWRNISVDKD